MAPFLKRYTDNANRFCSVGYSRMSVAAPQLAIGKMWQRNIAAVAASKECEAQPRLNEFETAALPHTQALLRTAKRLTRGDLSAAEDLVQETMLNAWRGFDRFERGTRCKSWLFRILLNLSSKRIQKLVASPSVVSLDALNGTEIADSTPASSPADMLKALNSLSEEHRAVLLLQVVEGFTCSEVAEILHVPIGTVMSRLSRAKIGLRLVLAAPAMARSNQRQSTDSGIYKPPSVQGGL